MPLNFAESVNWERAKQKIKMKKFSDICNQFVVKMCTGLQLFVKGG